MILNQFYYIPLLKTFSHYKHDFNFVSSMSLMALMVQPQVEFVSSTSLQANGESSSFFFNSVKDEDLVFRKPKRSFSFVTYRVIPTVLGTKPKSLKGHSSVVLNEDRILIIKNNSKSNECVWFLEVGVSSNNQIHQKVCKFIPHFHSLLDFDLHFKGGHTIHS